MRFLKLLLVGAFVFSSLAFPAWLTAGATADDDTVGATAQYIITFNMNVGVGPGSSITVTFDNGYNLHSNMIIGSRFGFGQAIDGGWSIGTPVGQSVTFTRDGTGTAAGPGVLEVFVSGVDNPQTAGTYTISLTTSDGAPLDGSSNVSIVAGQLSRFSLDTISTQTAGVNFSATVNALDAFGNAVSHTGTVTLSDNTGTLNASPLVFTSETSETATDVSIAKAQTGVIVTASNATGTITGPSNSFTVNPGSVNRFVVTNTSDADIGTQTAGTAFNIKVVAQDANLNTATSFTGTVAMVLNPGATSLGTSGSFVAGVLSSQSVTVNTAASAVTIDVSGSGATGTSNAFNVSAGAVSDFQIATIASPQTAGTAFGVVVTAVDAQGNTATGFTGTVDLSLNSGTLSESASDAFVSGAWNGSITVESLNGSSSNKRLIVANTANASQTDTSNSFTVNPGPLASFGFNTITTQTAGVNFSATVNALDAFGNAVSHTGTVTLDDNTGTLNATNLTFTNQTSQSATDVNIATAQTGVIITAKEDGGSVTGPSNSFTVNPGTVSRFLVTNTSDGDIGTQSAGTPFNIKIVAQDANLNTATSFTGTVAMALNPGATSLGTSGSFVAGVLSSQSVTVNTAASAVTIDVSGSGATGTSNAFNVGAGTVSDFQIATIGSPQTAGTAFDVVVTAVDAQGNTATGFTGTADLSLNSGTLSESVSAAFASGVWNGSITVESLSGSSSNKRLIVANTANTSQTDTSNSFTVNPGPLASFGFNTITTQTAGVNFSATVNALDAFGNAVSHTGTVTLSDDTGTLTASTLTFSSSTSETATDVNIAKAQASVRITARDGTITGESGAFTVNPGTVDGFVVTNTSDADIGTQTAGTAFNIKIVAQDASGNTVTSFTGTVAMVLNPGATSLGTSGSFTAGVLSSQSVTVNTAASAVTIDVSGSGATGTSNAFNVSHGALARFSIGAIVAQATNAPFVINITALDANDNKVTSFAGTVDLSNTTTSISPTVSSNFSDGLLSESVTISQSQTNDTITATRTGGAETGTSNAFNVSSTTVDHFTFSVIPDPQTAGTAFNITITAQDASNNTVDTFVDPVSINDITGRIFPKVTTNFVAGVLQDLQVTIDKAQAANVITATGVGRAGDSAPFDVNPGPLLSFTIDEIGSPQVANTPFNVVMTAKDAFDNTVTSFTGPVGLADNTGTLTPTQSGAFVAGVATQAVTVTQSATDNKVAVTFGAVSDSSNVFNVTSTGVASFAIAPITSPQVAGEQFLVTVTAKDGPAGTGNTVTSFAGTVNLALGGTGGTLDKAQSGTFSNGQWIDNLTVLSIAGNSVGKVLQVDDGGLITGASDPFDVRAGLPVGTVTLTPDQAILPADGISTAQVTSDQVFDANGNLVGVGRQFTVTVDKGSITTDADLVRPGPQVQTNASSQLDFTFQAGNVGGIVNVDVQSDSGSASGSTSLTLGSLGIISVATTPQNVSQGQLGIAVQVVVQNIGGSAITGISGANSTLTFTDRSQTSRTGEYSISRTDIFDDIPAGGQRTLGFSVDVDAAATIDTITIDGNVSGLIGGTTPVTADSALTKDSWSVQTPAEILLNEVAAANTIVSQGEQSSSIAISVRNQAALGSAAAVIDSFRINFLKDGVTLSNNSFSRPVPDPGNPGTIAPGVTSGFDFSVNVDAAADTGRYVLDAVVFAHDFNATNIVLRDSGATTTDEWRVKFAPNFQLVSLTPVPLPAYRAGRTDPWRVRAVVQNNSSDAIDLSFALAQTFIEFRLAQEDKTGEYGITQPDTLLGAGGNRLVAGSQDSLDFVISPTGTTTGRLTIAGTISGTVVGSGAAIDDSGFGEVDIRADRDVIVQSVKPAGVPNRSDEQATVNTSQQFQVTVAIQNNFDEPILNVEVALSSSLGSSNINQTPQTIPRIEANATDSTTFVVDASATPIPAGELFVARIDTATGENTGLGATIGTPLDNDVLVTIQNRANLRVGFDAEFDTFQTASDTFSVIARVTNLGDAEVDNSGELRLTIPSGYGFFAGNQVQSFLADTDVLWRVIAPSVETALEDFVVTINRTPLDINTGNVAQVTRINDTRAVQTLATGITIDDFRIIAPLGAADSVISTGSLLTFQAGFTSSDNVDEIRVRLTLPQDYSFAPGFDAEQSFANDESPATWQVNASGLAHSSPRAFEVEVTALAGGQIKDPQPIRTLEVVAETRAFMDFEELLSDAGNTVSLGQQFQLRALVRNTGAAGVEAPGELRLDLGNTGITSQEGVVRQFVPGTEVVWNLTAPAVPTQEELLSVTISDIPLDENTNSTAEHDENDLVKTRSIATTDAGSATIQSVTVLSPPGAADANGEISTSQELVVQARVQWSNVIARQVEISWGNAGYVTVDVSTIRTIPDEEGAITTTDWRLQAPPSPVPLHHIRVDARATDQNDASRQVNAAPDSLPFVLVQRAALNLTAAITSPASAQDRVLTVGQTFTVTGTLQNTGTAGLVGEDSLRMTLPTNNLYTTSTPLVQAVTPGNSVSWIVRAPNNPTNGLQDIVVSIADQNSTDENSGLPPPTIPSPVTIQVLTQATGLDLRVLAGRRPITIVLGATDVSIFGLQFNNSSDNDINLERVNLTVSNNEGEEIAPNSVIARFAVVDYDNPASVFATLSSVPASNAVGIVFSPPLTIPSNQSRSVDFRVDILQQTEQNSLRLTIRAPQDDIQARDTASGELVTILDDVSGQSIITSISPGISILLEAALEESFFNYPNPFGSANRPTTSFNYHLQQQSEVTIRIYTLLGKLVRTFSRQASDLEGEARTHFGEIVWDGRNDKNQKVLNGVYIAILTTSSGTAVTKIAVAK